MAQFQFQPDGRPGAGMKRQATWDALPDIDLFSSASERNLSYLERDFGSLILALGWEQPPADGLRR